MQESDPGTQLLDLTPEQVAEGTVVPLRFVKFQAVNNLSIFIGGNFGGDDQTVQNTDTENTGIPSFAQRWQTACGLGVSRPRRICHAIHVLPMLTGFTGHQQDHIVRKPSEHHKHGGLGKGCQER